MAITTQAELQASLENPLRTYFAKTGISGTSSAYTFSFFGISGNPPAAPTINEQFYLPTVYVYDGNEGYGLNQGVLTAGKNCHIARISMFNNSTNTSFEIHDRLAMSPVARTNESGTQSTPLNLDALQNENSNYNFSARKITADNSFVQFWLEIATPPTASLVVTVNYTNQLGVVGNEDITIPPNLNRVMIPVIVNGSPIKTINSMTMSSPSSVASYVAAVATVQRCEFTTLSGQNSVMEWSQTGLPIIHEKSCLMIFASNGGTTIASFSGVITFVQG